MQTWMVWTKTPVTSRSLQQLAQELGSTAEALEDQVIIEHGDARVYISRADVNDEENVLRDDVEYATRHLGTSPVSMVSMRIGHGSGSVNLAENIAFKAIQMWGGFLDRNEAS